MENADATLVMATADATGRTKREKIIKAKPFLKRFTVADLGNWAERKIDGQRAFALLLQLLQHAGPP